MEDHQIILHGHDATSELPFLSDEECTDELHRFTNFL